MGPLHGFVILIKGNWRFVQADSGFLYLYDVQRCRSRMMIYDILRKPFKSSQVPVIKSFRPDCSYSGLVCLFDPPSEYCKCGS